MIRKVKFYCCKIDIENVDTCLKKRQQYFMTENLQLKFYVPKKMFKMVYEKEK